MFQAILIHCPLLNRIIIYSKNDEHWSTKLMQKQSGNIKTKAYLSILIIHVISSSSSSLSSPMNFIEVKRKFPSNSQEGAAVVTATCRVFRNEWCDPRRNPRAISRACSDVWPRWKFNCPYKSHDIFVPSATRLLLEGCVAAFGFVVQLLKRFESRNPASEQFNELSLRFIWRGSSSRVT